MSQFEVTADARGDLTARGGLVRNLTGVVTIQVGQEEVGFFLGGSGLNLVVSGFPVEDFNGAWRWHRPHIWKRGDLTLTDDLSGGAVIADSTDDVATLSTGGPLGSYPSTTHGATRFGASFTAVIAAEANAPGAQPDAVVDVSGGTVPTGAWSHDTGTVWKCDADPDWTITVAADGSAEMSDGVAVVARRSTGDPGSPDGLYEATLYGRITYHPTPAPAAIPAPGDPDTDPAPHTADAPAALDPTTEIDPDVIVPDDDTPDPDPDPDAPPQVFGLLELIYSWPAEPDLDDRTTFLGQSVGYGYGYANGWLEHSGDDQSEAGSETVTIDLAAAYEASDISTVAEISCAADWYPEEATGPASLLVRYTVAGVSREFSLVIAPGNARPSTTLQTVLRIYPRNPAVVVVPQDWRATVSLAPRPAPEGVVYLAVTEASGELSACSFPKFAASLPSNTSTVFHVALATTDGAGPPLGLWTGPLLWRTGGGGGGTAAPFVEITEDDFIDLDPPDSSTYYDITDLIP